MQELQLLYCVGRGTPTVSGIRWFPAVLDNVTRRDPFSKALTASTVWTASKGTRSRDVGLDIAFSLCVRTSSVSRRCHPILS
jgi:hypothetical protein